MGEEGTGLGPTLEFYALVAAELQRKSLGMWLCDDEFPDDMAREVSWFVVSLFRQEWYSPYLSLISDLFRETSKNVIQ